MITVKRLLDHFLLRATLFVLSTSFGLVIVACDAPVSDEEQPQTKTQDKSEETTSDPEKSEVEENADESSKVSSTSIAIGSTFDIPLIIDPVLAADENYPEAAALAKDFNDQTPGALAIGGFSLNEKPAIDLSENTSSSSFSSITNASFAACRMVNRTRGFLQFAAATDRYTCDLEAMILATPEKKQLFDGNYHIIKLTDEDEISKIRFKVVKEAEKIVSLEFQVCEGDNQEFYATKKIKDGEINIYSKTSTEPDNPQVDKFFGETTVTGYVDSNFNFVGLKTIDVEYNNYFSSGAKSFVKESVKQSDKSVYYAAYMEQSDKEQSDGLLSLYDLVDENTEGTPPDLKNLEIGSGALYWRDGSNYKLQGWNPETLKIDNSLAVIEKLKLLKDQIPTTATAKEVTFSTEEAFDCSTEPDYQITYEEILKELSLAGGQDEGDEGEDEDEFCGGFYLPQDSYIECHDLTSQESAE